MSNPVTECCNYLNTTASALVFTGKGEMLGVFVASASASPTLKFWDNTSAATTVLVNTFTPTAGIFTPLPFKVQNGLYVTISGTVDCTIAFNPGV